MTKFYVLTEEELGTIAELSYAYTTQDNAYKYAILLADEIEGKKLTSDEICQLFESDEDKFPYTIEGLNKKFESRSEQTSSRISSLAASYLHFEISELNDLNEEAKLDLVKVIRSLAGSALTQDEKKGD